jgi:hypothetical protein
MSDFIKLLFRKSPLCLSMTLFFLLFSPEVRAVDSGGFQVTNRGHHWTERSKQRGWFRNSDRNVRGWDHRTALSNGDWGGWRRNNYYYGDAWGSPSYSYGWYGYQLPYYTNYWVSYPSRFANYTYPSYPYNGKWYTGSWRSFGKPTQGYHNTGYYSGTR